ncbi:uncharacterized protein LOC124263406 [Haliotis rubra]|uniref:uncharacterized protein LOC124263406 n=1 Tax=Haliotis rubra TaxID=36100 RepID=UPI001EE5D8D5|nr:uncharacterized protein LOC124263406 [Haliotis rubra]
MPIRWTSTGERFIQADRKNRVERARLDLQLKIYERERLRNWGLQEREKKFLYANIESVRRTSGSSNMGMAPAGPKDNSYEKSMHSRSAIRLSEKRLMEWRLCEKQLQRFLKQKAVAADDTLLDSRLMSSRSAWEEEGKKPVSAKERHGGKVEKERAEVQQRVSAFLHSGMHVVDGSPNMDGKSQSEAKHEVKRGSKDGRQRHHSEHVIRPHTAFDKTTPAVKQTPRPQSACVDNSSRKNQFLITKGDVYMNSGMQFTKISGSGPDTPAAKVNNFVHNLSRSHSPVSSDSEPDQDVFHDDTDTRCSRPPRDTDALSETSRSTLSDKSPKRLTKHVSIPSILDQLTEEEFSPPSHSTTRQLPHSAKSSKGSLYHIPRSGHSSKRRESIQTSTVLEISDEEDNEDRPDMTSTRSSRKQDLDQTHVYDAHKAESAVKSAMVFSKSSRKKALEYLINQNSPDKKGGLKTGETAEHEVTLRHVVLHG